jgi:putative solute:sodium symporter small subunit
MPTKQLPSEEAKKTYWRKNLFWLGVLLGVWFVVSYGCGILFVDQLDRFHLPGTRLKLGFWFAQQGSICVFVLIIAAYAAIMNRLDRQLLSGTLGEGRENS